jgi:hypothetical protein
MIRDVSRRRSGLGPADFDDAARSVAEEQKIESGC